MEWNWVLGLSASLLASRTTMVPHGCSLVRGQPTTFDHQGYGMVFQLELLASLLAGRTTMVPHGCSLVRGQPATFEHQDPEAPDGILQ